MKLNKDTPISDIILISIFFILLFVPVLKIDYKTINAVEENKTLAEFKPLIRKDKTINYNFGLDFNSWFSDRFYLRKKMIDVYNYIHYVFFKKNEQGWFEKENGIFMFEFESNHYDNYYVKYQFEYLFKLDKFFQDRNIKFYIIITPQRSDIYPLHYNPINKGYKNDKFIKYINSLNNENKLKIVFPYNEIKEETKKDLMYYKVDYHWTDDAAFIGYQKVMQLIKKDYPNIKVLSKNDFNYFYDTKLRINYNELKEYGTVFNPVGVKRKDLEKFINTKYRYYRHKNIDKLQDIYIDEKYKRFNYFYYPEGADLRVILLGPSTIEALSHTIPFTFKNVLKIRTNAIKGINDFKIMKYYKDIILNYKPDIIIFCIPYQSIYTFAEYMEME